MDPLDLLRAAGLTDIEEIDMTTEFLETARGWYKHSAELDRELRGTIGDMEFDMQQADRWEMIGAIEGGLLSRALFLATKPAAGNVRGSRHA